MAQHEKDPAALSSGVDNRSDAEQKTESVIRFGSAERVDAEASQAPLAGEADGAHDQPASTEQDAAFAPSAAGVLQPRPAPRKTNGLRFTLFAAILGLLATAGAIGAYRFRDKHEKLQAFAAIVDETFARPEKVISLIRDTGLKWLGDAARPSKKTADVVPEVPSSPPPPAPAAPEKKAADEAAVEKPGVAARGSNERITWSSPPPAAPAPAEPLTPPPGVPIKPPVPPTIVESKTGATPNPEAVDALTKRLDQLEQVAQTALQAAEEARKAASAPPTPLPSAPTNSTETQDALAGLEGRIDELADEIKALREKFEASKGETRLPREQAESRDTGEGAKKADPAAIVVVAHSLQKALERGAPFASEYAALSAQGADASALAALAPSAETGAPTGRQLRASFRPLAKQIEAIVEPKADAPLGDRLLHGVGKLVKVRPPGEQQGTTISEIVAKIDGALDHDDIGAALAAFDELPDNAKSVARAWAETAQNRLGAEKATATILSGAIAALGKSKS